MEQTTTYTKCPNCDSKLGSNILSSNQLLDNKYLPVIHEFTDIKAEALCFKCYEEPFSEAQANFVAEIKNINEKVQLLIKDIIIVSTHSPFDWQYKALGLVTGQSTTGTGVFSEVASSFTDLFGAQSGAYNEKLKKGEELCMSQLRMKCLELGGNAIISTDIDYSEVGGGKGMLMVCMAGTAVKVSNVEILGEERAESLLEIKGLLERKAHLLELANTYDDVFQR